MSSRRYGIGVVLAMEAPVLEAGFAAILDREDDITVVSTCVSGDRVGRLVKKYSADVAIVSVSLPRMDGIAVARSLHEERPDCGVVVVGSHPAPGTLLQIAEANADSYLTINAATSTVLQAVRKSAQKIQVIDPLIGLGAWRSYENPLKPREREILRLIAEGSVASEVATMLYLSEGTVRNHLTRIVAKLDARNRVEAVLIAAKAGWI